ncbi:MAG TPA: aldehyde dehydrogenase family protein [Acetobacteraceae bacterium]|nr:aldehyde dehydrogenase family protein [Acetobacteraceae bacterium]
MTYRLLIDGALVDGAVTVEVVNPATGRPFAIAPRADVVQLERAVAAAKRAFPTWSRTRWAERQALLAAIADVLADKGEEFARLLTQEQGKTLTEARGEMEGTIAAFRYFATLELSPRVLRDTATDRIVEYRHPLGVVAAIVPWNYPLLMLALKMAPALLAGNTLIAKPAPTTPLATLRLGEIMAEMVPAGVFQILIDENDLGPLLAAHPDIAHVSLTGSTATGRMVMGAASGTLKRLVLELGGNDAALLLDDADIASVAPKIFESAMANAGQVCFAIKRVYAPRALVGPLCDALTELARAAVIGDGMIEGTTMGPVHNRAQFDKLAALLDKTRGEGRIVAGGEVLPGEGYFIAPTVVRDLGDDALVVREEQFGPILPVLGYDNLDDAIARINASEYGLGGSVWTRDVERGIAVAAWIESGTVWVNKPIDLPFDIPVGGVKQSGMGRQQGMAGLEEFTQPRIVNAALG